MRVSTRSCCAFVVAGSLLAASAGNGSADAQSPAAPGRSLAERLGFPAGSRLVMVHADDAGATHSVNRAIKMAFENGSILSASIIVPSPWFREIDNDELRAEMGDGGFGALWRAADYDAFNSPAMRAFLKEQRVRLINYTHLKQLGNASPGAD